MLFIATSSLSPQTPSSFPASTLLTLQHSFLSLQCPSTHLQVTL
jgi:hypothetical protein